MNIHSINSGLALLCGKYGIPKSGVLKIAPDLAKTGVGAILDTHEEEIRLFPWRSMRRFTELKELCMSGTLEDVSTLRFCYFSGELPLEALVYRELDLCEWLGGAPVRSLFSVANGNAASNTLLKLSNGISCSIECSSKLTSGMEPIDRHEIIARRGVASDRVVDTQIPQASIYLYHDSHGKRFMDTDAELFGLSAGEISLVREAFEALKDPKSAAGRNARHHYLSRLLASTLESSREWKPKCFSAYETR